MLVTVNWDILVSGVEEVEGPGVDWEIVWGSREVILETVDDGNTTEEIGWLWSLAFCSCPSPPGYEMTGGCTSEAAASAQDPIGHCIWEVLSCRRWNEFIRFVLGKRPAGTLVAAASCMTSMPATTRAKKVVKSIMFVVSVWKGARIAWAQTLYQGEKGLNALKNLNSFKFFIFFTERTVNHAEPNFTLALISRNFISVGQLYALHVRLDLSYSAVARVTG